MDNWFYSCSIGHIVNNMEQNTFEFVQIGNFKNNLMTQGFDLSGLIHHMAS